jgi:hypothetical protein
VSVDCPSTSSEEGLEGAVAMALKVLSEAAGLIFGEYSEKAFSAACSSELRYQNPRGASLITKNSSLVVEHVLLGPFCQRKQN